MTQDALHPAVDPLAVREKAPLVQKLLLHIWMNATIHLVFAYGQLPIEGKNLPRQLPRETIGVGKITNLLEYQGRDCWLHGHSCSRG